MATEKAVTASRMISSTTLMLLAIHRFRIPLNFVMKSLLNQKPHLYPYPHTVVI